MSLDFAKPTTSIDQDQLIDLIFAGDRLFSSLKKMYTQKYSSLFNKPPPKLEKPPKKQDEPCFTTHSREEAYRYEPRSPISTFSLFEFRRNTEQTMNTESISIKKSDSTIDDQSFSCFRQDNKYDEMHQTFQLEPDIHLKKNEFSPQIYFSEKNIKNKQTPKSDNILANKYNNIRDLYRSDCVLDRKDGIPVFIDNEPNLSENGLLPRSHCSENNLVRKYYSDNNGMHPKKNIPAYNYNIEEENDGFVCSFCGARFFMKQQLGGHMSKRHAGQSEKYQKRLGRKKMREGIRKKRDYLMKIIIKEKNVVF